jgi:hypothetical protein
VAGPNHYELLQVSPTASRDELRQAFRALSKRYHPDTTALPAADAERVFLQLRLAYAVLSDPLTRQRYDGELRQIAARAPAAAAGAAAVSVPRPAASTDVRRALSGGEWLALLLLVLAVLFSLVLGVGLALARGVELVQWPAWWSPPAPNTAASADPRVLPLADPTPAAPSLAGEIPPG